MDTNQNIKGLPEGVLIKTKDGQFKIFKDGRWQDYQAEEILVKKEELKPAPTKPSLPPQAPVKPIIPPPSPAKPISASPYAVNIFHPDDEEEIKAFEEKVSALAPKPTIQDLDPVVKEIIEKNSLTFSDEILEKRFYKVIESRLLDVRDSIETMQLLMRPEKIGGLGFEETLAKKVIDSAEAEAAKIHEWETVKKLKEEVIKEWRKPVMEEIKETPQPKIPIHPRAEEVKPVKTVPVPEVPESVVKPMEQKAEQPAPIKIPVILPKVEEIRRQMPPRPKPGFILPKVIRPEVAEDLRPKVVDIKKPVRLVGPVEELSLLNLNDFRQLGETVNESIKKLLDKFSLLEEESFTKRQEGVSAWHNSPVYKLYLEMGNESIETSRTIKEIINSREKEGKPCLTEEEFYAVVDFNKKLRL